MKKYATKKGAIRDIDTSVFREGDDLYLSPTDPGKLVTQDWKHLPHMKRKSQYQDDSDFTIMVTCIILGIAMTIIWSEELWSWIDWILTVEENFRRA